MLLEITPIAKSEDVHDVVGRVQERAQAIIKNELKLDSKAIMGFAMTLSEVCQNIIEHAGQGGWVAVQSYKWTKRLGRRVVVIAVCDAGLGFRKSLESTPGHTPSARWDDAAALEEAVIRGVSRFRDRGRGQGLAGARNYVGRWNGKLSVRSGTARISIVPSWDDDVPLAEGLAPFPGAQVQVIIPEAIAGGDGAVMNHIDISSVLRQTLACDLYSNLVTRPTGAAVRGQIELLLSESTRRARSPSSTSRRCR